MFPRWCSISSACSSRPSSPGSKRWSIARCWRAAPTIRSSCSSSTTTRPPSSRPAPASITPLARLTPRPHSASPSSSATEIVHAWADTCSDRDLEELLSTNLLVRRCIGLPLSQPAPNHSTLAAFHAWMTIHAPDTFSRDGLRFLDQVDPEDPDVTPQIVATFALQSPVGPTPTVAHLLATSPTGRPTPPAPPARRRSPASRRLPARRPAWPTGRCPPAG